MSNNTDTKTTGYWLNQYMDKNDITGNVFGECSICHSIQLVTDSCPHCGSKMVEETENE